MLPISHLTLRQVLLNPIIMRSYLSTLLILAGALFLIGQTTIVLEAGPISHNNIDGFIDEQYSADISLCSSIAFSISYEFSLPWEGDGNMEYCDEESPSTGMPVCIGGCACDVTDPTAGACDGCWDFMWVEFEIDGSPEDELILGGSGATDADQVGTYQTEEYCVDGATMAQFNIRNQNWASNETNTYANVSIICWQAVPNFSTNAPVCSNSNLDLTGTAVNPNDVVSWEWDNDGNGTIDDPNIQSTFATGAEDNETYSLTTTDVNNCTAVTEQMVSISTFDAELSGGGDVCIDNCTNEDSDVTVEIAGGTGPYTASFTVNGISIPQAPVIDIDETFRICIDEDAIVPFIDDSFDPPRIVMASFYLPITLELDNITDNTGCAGNIIGGGASIQLADPPPIFDPGDQEICSPPGAPIDLTTLDDIINGGSGDEVIYYLEDDPDEEITDPDSWVVTDTEICARTYDGTCYSEFLCFGIDLDLQPLVEIIQSPITSCTDDMFAMPPLGQVANVDPISLFTGYYLDAAGTDGPYFSVPYTTTEVWIVIEALGGSCNNVAEPIELNLTHNPVIFTPGNQLGGCGGVELPQPTGEFFNSFEYNTEENGTGTSFTFGDIIDPASSGINEIWLILNGDNGCNTTQLISLEASTAINYNADIPTVICDSLVLPPINPTTPTVSYFADQGGTTPIAPGTVLNAPYNQTLFMFDPNVDQSCAPIVPVDINISSSPFTTLPMDTTVCEFLVLGPIRGNTSMSAYYAIDTTGNPASRRVIGDSIKFDQKLFIIDTIGGCSMLDSMNIQIQLPPDVGQNASIEVCEGFISETINFYDQIGTSNQSGTWSAPSFPDFNPVDYNRIDVSTLPIGMHVFTYLIEDPICGSNSSDLIVNIIPLPFSGLDFSLEECMPSTYNFMELISFPVEGGFWQQVPMDTFNIIDSTNVDLSNLEAGTYTFLYTLEGPANTFCQNGMTTLSINIIEGPNAGLDNNTTACLGDIVNLRSLLSADADANGLFEPNGFLLTGDEWNTNGSTPDQSYFIEYIVNSAAASCPNDTSRFEIFLTNAITAGDAVVQAPVCAGQEIDLQEYLENESLGGLFFDANDNSPITNPWIVDMQRTIKYVIEGSGGCESDSIEFAVDVNDQALIDIQLSGSDLCQNSNECIELVVTSNYDGEFFVRIVPTGGSGQEEVIIVDVLNGEGTLMICAEGTFGLNGNGVFELNDDTDIISLFYEEYQIQECEAPTILTPPGQINLNQSTEETFEGDACAGEAAIINGEMYMASEVLQLTSVNGCDSIVNIIVNNFPEAISEVNGALCEGTSLDVFGTTISRDTVARFVEAGASFNGCDSIVDVNIVFQSVAIGILDDIICDGMPQEVEGNIYDENNPSDTINLPGGSVAGCDSTIYINFTFASEVINDEVAELCAGTDIEIGGNTYNENNPSDIIVLPGMASNGCDSIINVDLTFVAAVEERIEEVLCEDETREINGVTFDINNPSDQFDLTSTNGCDSTLIVNFTFQSDVEVNIENDLCEGEVFPFNGIDYDVNNPTDVVIVPGAGGCDTIFNINLTFLPAIELLFDQTLCEGDSFSYGGNTYDASNPTDMFMIPGQGGCDTTVTVDLSFSSALANIILEQTCEEEAGATLESVMGLQLPLEISINGMPNLQVDVLPYDFAISGFGMTEVIVTDGNCSYEETIERMGGSSGGAVTLDQSPLGNDQYQLTLNTSVNVNLTSLEWTSDNNNTSISCIECIDPIVSTTEATVITVTFLDEDGCDYTAMTTITPIPVIEEGEVFIPNIFQLGGGTNQSFYPQSSSPPVTINSMVIFDRWGNTIFERTNFPANDASLGWNGTRDGNLIEQGVYMYVIELASGEIKAGSVTLVR